MNSAFWSSQHRLTYSCFSKFILEWFGILSSVTWYSQIISKVEVCNEFCKINFTSTSLNWFGLLNLFAFNKMQRMESRTRMNKKELVCLLGEYKLLFSNIMSHYQVLWLCNLYTFALTWLIQQPFQIYHTVLKFHSWHLYWQNQMPTKIKFLKSTKIIVSSLFPLFIS